MIEYMEGVGKRYIFAKLDMCLKEIQAFETDLKQKLKKCDFF